MRLKNGVIYTYASNLAEAFQDSAQRFPMRINFYLQKNKNTLIDLAKDIETSRLEIIQSYGKLSDDESQYILPADKVDEAQKELNDLLNLEQEVNIYMIPMDSLTDDISLTTEQMEAMMFMIE